MKGGIYMNEKIDNDYREQGLGIVTFLIIIGILITYVGQMSPAPVLSLIVDDLNINMAQAGLAVSIIFPMMIIVSLAGGYLEQWLGIKKLYIGTMMFIGIGMLMYLVAANYILLLISRILFGIGFGLGIPFIGAAIMKWYNSKQREFMNTINGLFPFVGTFIVFGATMPLYKTLGNSWQAALSVWGFAAIVIAVIWALIIKERAPVEFDESADSQDNKREKNLYGNLWKRKEIKLLTITFICDFFSYAFIASMLPTYYHIEAGVSMATANNLAMLFPVAGLIGCSIGGIAMSKSGRRKPVLWFGQIIKFFGIVMASLGGYSALGLTGVVLVGIGNSMWMPPMYMVPCELEGMTPTRVGAAFAFISACGFVSGFISPIVGGWLSDLITMKWSLFAFAFPNLIGFASCLMIRETGPHAKVQNTLPQEQKTVVDRIT